MRPTRALRRRPRGLGATVAAAGLGYAAGLLPSAQLASRWATGGAVDLRVEGSGNPGATNAAARLGARWGLVVLGLDLGKGILAAMAGRRLGGASAGYAAGAASIAGHVYPATHGFRGGKGVATSAGASLVLFPAYFPLDAAVAALAATGTRDADRAIRISCVAWMLAALVWWRRRLPNAWGPAPTAGLVAFAAVGSGLMLTKVARSAGRDRGRVIAPAPGHGEEPRRT